MSRRFQRLLVSTAALLMGFSLFHPMTANAYEPGFSRAYTGHPAFHSYSSYSHTNVTLDKPIMPKTGPYDNFTRQWNETAGFDVSSLNGFLTAGGTHQLTRQWNATSGFTVTSSIGYGYNPAKSTTAPNYQFRSGKKKTISATGINADKYVGSTGLPSSLR